jgi:DNA repair protein RadA/Sms
MAKQKTIYVCQNCGGQSPKWLGKCPDCDSWNTFAEETVGRPEARVESARGLGRGEAKVVTLSEAALETEVVRRTTTGLGELDRVLGGGVVPGSFTLIGGDPGIGKSTIMLQTVANLARGGQKVLYISGEESVGQTQMRARRLGATSENLFLASETNLDVILDVATKIKPYLVVIDSIQTVFLPALQSAPGSVSQVRECAAKLMFLAKTEGISVFLVGHITKEGSIAGPKVLEHMVDTVMSFEGDPNHQYRILRGIKNRFGAANEMGVFEMTSSGLVEVENPSELFLSERAESAPGSAVFCTVEGTRPFLVEVQALATRTNMAMPRRTSLGVDPNRVHLLLAIMDKHLRLDLYAHDVFVNIAGGVKLNEPAVDLAVAAALLSSLKNVPIPKSHCFFGELGLTGEVRGVSFPELRLKEAHKLGFERFYAPQNNQRHLKHEKGVGQIVWLETIKDLQKSI